MESMTIREIFRNISKEPVAVRNNSGGYFNHTFYWESMKSHGGGMPTGRLSKAIGKTFTSFDEFKKQFSEAGKTRFGSGWAWLCLDDSGCEVDCFTTTIILNFKRWKNYLMKQNPDRPGRIILK